MNRVTLDPGYRQNRQRNSTSAAVARIRAIFRGISGDGNSELSYQKNLNVAVVVVDFQICVSVVLQVLQHCGILDRLDELVRVLFNMGFVQNYSHRFGAD